VQRCGGECAKDGIRRSWDRITTPECRAAFNWHERKKLDKKKYKLQGSLVVDAVHGEANRNCIYLPQHSTIFFFCHVFYISADGIRKLFPGVSDYDLEKLTRTRFVRAPEKVNKKKSSVIDEKPLRSKFTAKFGNKTERALRNQSTYMYSALGFVTVLYPPCIMSIVLFLQTPLLMYQKSQSYYPPSI
jgi:hypothetical protein